MEPLGSRLPTGYPFSHLNAWSRLCGSFRVGSPGPASLSSWTSFNFCQITFSCQALRVTPEHAVLNIFLLLCILNINKKYESPFVYLRDTYIGLWEFHTMCFIISIPSPTALRSTPHFSIHPTSCPTFLLNPCRSICAAHMFLDVCPSAGTWPIYQCLNA